jgi:hypothetical protein
MKKNNLKRKFFVACFSLLVISLPLINTLAANQNKAFTLAAYLSDDKVGGTIAIAFDTGVGMAMAAGLFCGIQAVVAVGVAG